MTSILIQCGLWIAQNVPHEILYKISYTRLILDGFEESYGIANDSPYLQSWNSHKKSWDELSTSWLRSLVAFYPYNNWWKFQPDRTMYGKSVPPSVRGGTPLRITRDKTDFFLCKKRRLIVLHTLRASPPLSPFRPPVPIHYHPAWCWVMLEAREGAVHAN